MMRAKPQQQERAVSLGGMRASGQRSCMMAWWLFTALILGAFGIVDAVGDNGSDMILHSLPKVDALRRGANTINSTVLLQRRPGETVDSLVNTTDDSFLGGICGMVDLNVYSIFPAPNVRIAFPATLPWQGLAAISLALHHLNTGNGVVVEELNQLETCPIQFAAEFRDTSLLENQAVDAVVDITQNGLSGGGGPCAFTGAFRSQVSIPTALLTGLKGYPQVSVLSASPQLNDKTQYPLFGRVIPANDEYGGPLLEFLYTQWNVRHLAVVYTDNTVGLPYVAGIRRAQARQFPDMEIRAVAFPDQSTDEDYAAAVDALAQTGFRYFFCVARRHHLQALLPEAVRQGIAGDGLHNWMISNEQALTALYVGQNFSSTDVMKKAGVGLMAFSRRASRPGIGRYTAFAQAMQELGQSSADLEYLQTKIPTYPGVPSYNPLPLFQQALSTAPIDSVTPSYYDAAILVGLAACRAAQGSASPPTTFFTGAEHYQQLLQTSFIGASGQIALDPNTGSRIATSSLFSMINYVPYQLEGASNYSFREVEVASYSDKTWEMLEAVVFNDGSTVVAQDLEPVRVNQNYIGSRLRAVGLVLSILVMVSSLCFSLWTFRHGKERVVLASQPIFLHLLCFGTAMMGSAIVPFSFDEEVNGVNLNASCRVVPWLWSLGWCIAFSALFTKTMRVNRIFHNPGFRRVKVTATDVMKPLAVLTCLNFVILILWTTLDPLTWERDVVETDRFGRPSETRGECQSDNVLAYLIPLLTVNLGALSLAVYQAYVARQISVEFAESDYIARASSLILVVAFMAIPIAVIAQDNNRAFFFVASGFVFVVCASLLGFIFVPKIVFQWQAGDEESRQRMATSVSQTVRRLNNKNSNDSVTSSSFHMFSGSSHPMSTENGLNLPEGNKDSVGDLPTTTNDPSGTTHSNPTAEDLGRDTNSVRIVSTASSVLRESTMRADENNDSGDDEPSTINPEPATQPGMIRRLTQRFGDNDDEQGIRILEHPKQQRDLELQVAFLQSENDRLQRRMEKLRKTIQSDADKQVSSEE